MEELELFEQYQKNILLWIDDMFWLKPQKVLFDYRELLEECRASWEYNEMRLDMFEPFVRWEMITRQQTEVCIAINEAVNGWKRKIAIRSGHGIGKSAIMSLFILWFLFCYYLSIVGCTAPTSAQMNDVLRKELNLWINRLPLEIKDNYERTSEYIRMRGNPEARFARARTGKKENSEALAGLHSDDLVIAGDEASGIYDEIRTVAKSALTNANTLLLMISNPTRLEGYFYKAFNKLSHSFHTLHFNSEESPIVDKAFVNEIIDEFGVDSDEYRVRVLWEFPKSAMIDEKGYIPLLNKDRVTFVEPQTIKFNKMGIDCWWQWKDTSEWIARDDLVAQILCTEHKSTSKSIAQKTLTLMTEYNTITNENTYYDNFWTGANVGDELAGAGFKCKWCNVWDKADDPIRFLNKRAECYWRLKEAIEKWFALVWTEKEREDIFMIKYKRTTKWQIKIMPKVEMKKLYWKSPDRWDWLALTFRDRKIKSKKLAGKNKTFINPITWELQNFSKKDLSRKKWTEWI